VSKREEGDLGIALELARQAQGLWPAYADARSFLAEVQPQATAAARQAIAQATAAAQEASRQATAQARAASAARAAQACQEFQSAVRSIDPRRIYISAVSCDGLTLRVVVGTQWHYEPYQVRKQMAQAIWQVWARLAAPEAPDQARLQLRDLMGNDVGGSSWLAGSLVDVKR
jgi:hypothetical protein